MYYILGTLRVSNHCIKKIFIYYKLSSFLFFLIVHNQNFIIVQLETIQTVIGCEMYPNISDTWVDKTDITQKS